MIFLRIVFIFFFSSQFVYSQNLVESLDDCKKVKSLFTSSRDPVKGHCRNWYSLSAYGHYHSNLCSCGYKYSETELDYTLNLNTCLLDIVNANTSSCNVVHLNFGSHVTSDPFSEIANGYWSNYLIHKFSNPLTYDKFYKLSFDIYIDSRYDSLDNVVEHLGVAFNYSRPHVEQPYYALNTPFIKLDTVLLDQWYRQTFIINPLCDFNYLSFGVFASDTWPNYYSTGHFSFYIADVFLESFEATNNDSIDTYDCIDSHSYSVENDTNDTLTFYYDSNEFELDSVQNLQLANLAFAAKSKMKIINIDSYTDDIGSANQELSLNRAEFIKNRLIQDYKIDSLFIVSSAHGELLSNNSNLIDSRKENRKSDVSLSDYTIDHAYYENALKALSIDNMILAKTMLIKWCHVTLHSQKLFILIDPRLEVIKDNSFWNKVRSIISSSYSNHIQPRKSFFLDSLAVEDQFYRSMYRNFKSLTFFDSIGYYYGIDQFYDNVDSTLESRHDSMVLEELMTYLDKHGYPSINKFGSRANRSCFMILAHSANAEVIEKYLPFLKESCRIGESRWEHYATLLDKSMFLRNMPQVYGTQYVSDEGLSISYYKFDNIVAVNNRRKLLGLDALPKEVPFSFK